MPKHCCCSCCFRVRLIIVTERHHSVVLPRPNTTKSKIFGQKYLGRQCLLLPLIKSVHVAITTFSMERKLDGYYLSHDVEVFVLFLAERCNFIASPALQLLSYVVCLSSVDCNACVVTIRLKLGSRGVTSYHLAQ